MKIKKKEVPIIVGTVLAIAGAASAWMLLDNGVMTLDDALSNWKSTIQLILVFSALAVSVPTISYVARLR